jgi:DNA processing protein
VAVVGTGLDRVYPARNRDLARAIAERGALISEFALGTPAQRANFPRRNRLISGLARGVLVVEATLSSGSLITARLAGEQGREVFALPGSIHSPFSKGCHRLIRDGAKLVETAQDILDELRLPLEAAALPRASRDAVVDPVGRAVLAALAGAPATVDTLVERTGLAAGTLVAALTALELEGRVAPVAGGRWQRRE